MKNIFFLSIAVLVFTAFSFKNSKEFKVIYIPNSKTSVSGVTIGYYENGKLVQNKAKKEGGQFIITGTVPEIKKGDLVLFTNSEKGFSMKFTTFILEPGSITIDASGESTVFSGTPLQNEFTAFTNIAVDISDNIVKQQVLLNGYEKAKDVVNVEETGGVIEALMRQREKYWEKYFEKGSNPVITAFALKDYVTEDWINLEKAKKYFNTLPKAVKQLSDVQLFGKRLSNTLALTPGNKCPDFSLPNEEGKMVSLNQFTNKYLLIDFWASWCGPCRTESPNLVDVYNQYNSKGFEILNISFDKEKKAWLNAIEQDKYTWTNVIDEEGMSDSKVAALFNITSIPKNLLIDRNGIIVARNIKGTELKKKLAELIK